MSPEDRPGSVRRDDMPEAAVRDHLANERTQLAWQRTALGVIAIGFLVDRFAVGDSGAPSFAPVVGVLLLLAHYCLKTVDRKWRSSSTLSRMSSRARWAAPLSGAASSDSGYQRRASSLIELTSTLR